MSNSGCDIAVDLCHVADEVYVSHRSGGRIVSGSPLSEIWDRPYELATLLGKPLRSCLTIWSRQSCISL
jgi:cation diffusion facilitator CzcD-associated flavoprotein CzcO